MKAVTVTTSITELAAKDIDRSMLHVHNNSASITVYLDYDGLGVTLTASNGMPLAPGATILLDNDGRKRIFAHGMNAITASGTADVRIQGD